VVPAWRYWFVRRRWKLVGGWEARALGWEGKRCGGVPAWHPLRGPRAPLAACVSQSRIEGGSGVPRLGFYAFPK